MTVRDGGGATRATSCCARSSTSSTAATTSCSGRGRFRARGDVVEMQPAYSETAYRISLFGDEVESITHFDPLSGEVFAREDEITIYPATHYVTTPPTIERAAEGIREELEAQVARFEEAGKLLEAHRLRQRTEYDMEMMRELGYCNGIENYSRMLDGRAPGQRRSRCSTTSPATSWSFDRRVAPDRAADRRHVRGRPLAQGVARRRTASGCRSRWTTGRCASTSSSSGCRRRSSSRRRPGRSSCAYSSRVVEQIIRPTGLIDPEVEVRPTRHQIDDLLAEIRLREEAGERVLVTTLTKKMAEDLTDYLIESGVRARYLHSEIDTLERIQIIRDLRLGEYDVLVGVNLLREGLDLPEVSLVAILDADKEGFLRGQTALIQTIGRAARNVNGRVRDVRRQAHAGDRRRDRRDRRAGARSSSRTTRSTASRRSRS